MKLPASAEAVVHTFAARAFTHKSFSSGIGVLGNPARVHFFAGGMPLELQCRRMVLAAPMPMTAFVAPVGSAGNGHFTIRYFTPEGRPFPLCGHATMVASLHLQQLLGLDQLWFNPMDLRDADTVILEASVLGQFVQVQLPAYPPMPFLHEDLPSLVKALGLKANEVIQLQRCNRLHDLLVQVADARVLRRVQPQMLALAQWLDAFGVRGLFITSLSAEPEADVEVRIFAPHLGINEDVSCGSANCSILPFWTAQWTGPLPETMRVLCPYNQPEQSFGGLEFVQYRPQDAQVRVGGYLSAL